MKRPEWTTDEQGRHEFRISSRCRVYLETPTERGTSFVSSFGPDSEDSFSGFLPGITDPEPAKTAAIRKAAQLWKGGPKDGLARRILSEPTDHLDQ